MEQDASGTYENGQGGLDVDVGANVDMAVEHVVQDDHMHADAAEAHST